MLPEERVGSQVFIKGNMNPVHMLLDGTSDTVRKDAEYRIEKGKPGGGFILSTACSIAPHTKRENVQILSQVACEMCVY